ncbi:hypothetical protein HanXRQr2_Chr01g0013531 [Helianthus annuus]|uniref:Secreted protein n=1 Tax=Helianthus annuus TaxID=4232 RepID=A0A251VNB7_HELAN|nr:hypothetical protein HanXRQr2_Chr01g0013531 [Helianthus annuus]KAJ0956289.1 hypothetical protein HanPSC8_Chr01g0013071 [Helianthus annuus]
MHEWWCLVLMIYVFCIYSASVNCLNHMKLTRSNNTDGIPGQCNCFVYACLTSSNQRLAFGRKQT